MGPPVLCSRQGARAVDKLARKQRDIARKAGRRSPWPEEQQNVLCLRQNRSHRPSQGPSRPLHPQASSLSAPCTRKRICGTLTLLSHYPEYSSPKDLFN